jgi:hypothetical protein
MMVGSGSSLTRPVLLLTLVMTLVVIVSPTVPTGRIKASARAVSSTVGIVGGGNLFNAKALIHHHYCSFLRRKTLARSLLGMISVVDDAENACGIDDVGKNLLKMLPPLVIVTGFLDDARENM